MEKLITTPLTQDKIKDLKAGDMVRLSGTIYTARDAAHKRLVELLEQGKSLPIDLNNAIIYYVGPAPNRPGQAIGSAGPTTSYRMDPYTPALLDRGLRGMIGKGLRSGEVKESMIANGAVYFAAIGGVAALMANSIKRAEIVAYEDLGSEAIRKLEVVDMPLIVAIDSEGTDLYEVGKEQYLSSAKDR